MTSLVFISSCAFPSENALCPYIRGLWIFLALPRPAILFAWAYFEMVLHHAVGRIQIFPCAGFISNHDPSERVA